LSIGGFAAEGTWPILLTNGSGFSDEVKDVIDDYLALPGSAGKALIVGGPAAVSTSIEDYLLDEAVGFAVTDVRRIGGADRSHTNFLVNLWSATDAAATFSYVFNTDNIALASGVSPWDALAASGWAAGKNAHIVLVPASGSSIWSATLMATASGFNDGFTNQDVNVYLLGGKSVMPAAALTAAAGAANSDLTATLTGCAEGGNTATLMLSGRLKDATGPGSPSEETQFDAMGGVSANGDRFELNGVDQIASASKLPTLTDLGVLTGVASRQMFLVTLGGSQTFAEDDVLEFEGWVEDSTYGGHKATRSISAASCEVSADETAPTVVSARAYPGATAGADSADARIEVRFSEPVALTLSAGTVTNSSNSDSNSATATATAIGSSGTNYMITFDASDTMATWDALDVVVIDASAVSDLAGNTMDDPISLTVAADSTAPVLTVSAVECNHATGSNYSMAKSPLTITAGSTGKFGGAQGAGFKMSVVNQRGILVPTVDINETTRTITVTADTGYHTPNDVAAVMAQNWQTNAVLGNWSVGASSTLLAATTSAVSATGGASSCSVDFSTNENVVVDDGTYSLGGGLSGFGTVALATSGVTYTASTTALTTSNLVRGSLTFTVNTAVLGSGSIVVSATDGIANLNDKYVALPLDITLS